MELFGTLKFVGELETVQTLNNVNGMNESFGVRDICVSTFTVGSSNGVVVPYMRQVMLRLSRRQAECFALQVGSYVVVEYSNSCRTYRDKQDGRLRLIGNNTVSRICQVTESDLEMLQRPLQVCFLR